MGVDTAVEGFAAGVRVRPHRGPRPSLPRAWVEGTRVPYGWVALPYCILYHTMCILYTTNM